jgi:NYN domain
MTNEKSIAAFLIDADNLSSIAIEEAFGHLERVGKYPTVRRAYGGLEKLAGAKEVLRKKAILALVNQGKGTTDVALVVDAMDLLHRAELPATVAIGSSDADFAPLAVRLREAGMRVIYFAEPLKADVSALARAYDEVVYVGITDQAASNFNTDAPSQISIPVAIAAPVSAASKSASKTSSNEDPATVRLILAEIPGWLPNTVRQLNQLGKPLRESGVKKGNKPLHELFSRHPTYFKVLPSNGAAKQIRLLKNP